MPDVGTETLVEYELITKRLLAISKKEGVERAARVLASYVGHYQLRYGVISAVDIATINSLAPSPDEVTARVEALRVLAAALTLAAVEVTLDDIET